MSVEKNSQLGQYKWHIVVICAVVGGVFALAIFTKIFENTERLRDYIFLTGALIFLMALLTMLSRVSGIVSTLRDNSSKMEEAARALEHIRDGLMQINRSTRISEAVKAIAFRDEDRQSLRDAVFDKLKQKDFDGAYELIDDITNRSDHKALADELRQQVDAYRNATEDERIDQAIAHIQTLFNSSQWAKASVQIESLIRAHPEMEKVKAMRQQLVDRKDERKKILLAAWDDAVQQQETDRSLEILKELDMYLSPNEGLALQEAAKDVFRTKLHNLGVRFAMAVSDRQWDNALDIGQQIMRDFPNSRMSVEIRDKLAVLQQNVQMQQT
jgi:MinD-like ATPase involved in chromosome partitioning or flagellar assembly